MITSRKNPRIQFLRSLIQDRKTREDSGLFLLEGVRLVEEAMANEAAISEAFYTASLSDRGKQLVDNLVVNHISVEEVEETVFHTIMDTSHNQGIAAVCQIPKTQFPEKSSFIILADQLHDPGNLGTLLRTAAAAGAQAVITTPGTVDLFSPKVLRSAMGAHFHLSCAEMGWEQIERLLHANNQEPFTVYTAAADGSKCFWECDFTHPTLLVIGSEAEGVSEKAIKLTDHKVSVPMPGNFESLNAAVAAGIIIFEIARQRMK